MNRHPLIRLVGALRALLRSEVRELLRHRGRSLWIVLLIAVPVAAIVAGATIVRVTQPTAEERRAREMGAAELTVERPFDFRERRRLLSLFSEGTRAESVYRGTDIVTVGGRSLRSPVVAISVVGQEAASAGTHGLESLTAGLFFLEQGRLPRNPGEVALSQPLLDGLERRLGDSVLLEYGGERSIVGLVADPEDLDTPLVVRTAATVEHASRADLLIDLPTDGDPGALAARLEDAGFESTLRSDLEATGGELSWVLLILGAIGFLEAGLVMAATFVVGLRRRQVQIGLLGATGATSGTLATALVASAGVLAMIGSLLGVALGLLAAGAIHPLLDDWNRRVNGPYEIAWWAVGASVAMAMLVALLSTVAPARAAAGVPVRAALGGRRPPASRSERWLGAGLGMVALGVMAVLLAPREPPLLGAVAVVGGSVAGVLGFGVASPYLLGAFGELAGRLPIRWRLAVRDAGRFRGRNGPVVTAVLAGMSMSVTVAVLVASVDSAIDTLPSRYRSDQLLVAGPGAEEATARLLEELPGVRAAPLRAVYAGGEPVRVRPRVPEPSADTEREETTGSPSIPPTRAWIACADSDVLSVFGLSSQRGVLDSGSLLGLPEPEAMALPSDRTSTLPAGGGTGLATLVGWRSDRTLSTLPLVTVDDHEIVEPLSSPGFFLSLAAVERLGSTCGPPLDRTLVPWIVRLDRPVSRDTLRRASNLVSHAVGVTIDAKLLHRRPARAFYRAVQWLCILTGLAVVLIATALSAAESRADARILSSVGAPPAFLRGHAAARAAYLALLGCTLALPAGLIPTIVLFDAANLPLEVVVPWLDLAVALVALPILTYLVTWLAGGSWSVSSGARKRLAWWRSPAMSATGILLTALFVGPAPDPAVSVGRETGPSRAATAGAGVSTAVQRQTTGPEGVELRSEVDLEPWVGKAFDGSPLPGELGRFRVPEHRDRPDGPRIELAFVRYRTRHPEPGPPVLYLAGGPGASGVEFAGIAATHPQLRLLEQVDVIGLDQRGTGLSRPSFESDDALLNTPSLRSSRLALDRAASREEILASLEHDAEVFARAWRELGIDITAWNTRESADDVDALRRALGLETVVTWGTSYGSHLALAHLRRHPDTLARAILGRIEGPDHTVKLPSVVQRQLEALDRRVATDPAWRQRIPSLLALVEKLLNGLERSPARVELGGGVADDTSEVLFAGPWDLRVFLSNLLSTADGTAEVPDHLIAFRDGVWTALAETVREQRSARIELMPWAMDCASGASSARLALVREQSRDPANLLGDAILAPHHPLVCRPCRGCDLGETFRAPVAADVPVLLTSGTLDVRTPPENGVEVASTLEHAAHVIVENAGHESRELMSPEYRALFQAFLRGEPVSSIRIVLPPVPLRDEERLAGGGRRVASQGADTADPTGHR